MPRSFSTETASVLVTRPKPSTAILYNPWLTAAPLDSSVNVPSSFMVRPEVEASGTITPPRLSAVAAVSVKF
mgnify:CR=1 FL=1